MIRYGSVCSGIEAASVAWHPLGWQPAFFSEIERFPCEVLAHHYGSNLPGEELARNGVPNLGDMTKFMEWPDAAIDVLVGGTPCQSFSVAGLRAGLADPRGNLMLTYLAIAARYRPRWLVWENVPGVLSSGDGRDFGTFLQGLGELGYGFAYRVLDAQYVRVGGFGRAVPQRRRRVFVVGYLGDWRRAAAVFFDGASLRGDSAPRREAGQRVAPTISARTKGGGGLGTDFDLDGGIIQVAPTLRAGGNRTGGDRPPGTDVDTADSLIAQPIVMMERGRDGVPSLEYRQDGTANAILTPNGGRGGLGVGAIAFDTTQITSKANRSNPQPGDPSHPLSASAHPPAIAIQAGTLRVNPDSGPDGVGVQEGISYTLEARAEVQAVAFAQQAGGDQTTLGYDPEAGTAPTLSSHQTPGIHHGWAVRRLTPLECERLQGFPDGYTAIPRAKDKIAADGPRYKALGNSMAVNAMRWIGERISLVDAMTDAEAEEAA